jgi:hypothetical protein
VFGIANSFAFLTACRLVMILCPSSNSTKTLFIRPRATTRHRWPLRSTHRPGQGRGFQNQTRSNIAQRIVIVRAL